MNKEYAITLEDIIGLLESIRLIEGATLSLDKDVVGRCGDEIEWCTSTLVGLLESQDDSK